MSGRKGYFPPLFYVQEGYGRLKTACNYPQHLLFISFAIATGVVLLLLEHLPLACD
jgi:hypothetical protein